MIDGLVLEERKVEFVVDQRFSDMRLEVYVPANLRQIAQTRALIGYGKRSPMPNAKVG